MDINQKLTEELEVKRWQVDAAVKLIDEGNTIPFISRYRKEATGSLNDEQLRKLHERLVYLRNLEEKKEQVLSSIEEQGKLTEELKSQILEAGTLVVVEDLYRPYRPKRRTRATIAKEKGLEPLAAVIILQKLKMPLLEEAEKYVSEEKGVVCAEDAIAGAKDIIAESISDEADYRSWIRKITMKKGKLISTAKDPEAESVYEMYYEFEEPLSKLAGHRILALNRGEKEKILTVKIEAPEEEILGYLEKQIFHGKNLDTEQALKEAVEDSYKRLIGPAIEREIRSDLTEKAENGAIEVFGKNLHQLLMQPPITGQVVLGWDPAFRTGCKLAVVDPTGKVLGTTVIYPTAPTTPAKIKASKDLLKKIIPKYHITLISLGNGTASRESEQFIVELLKEIPEKVQYVIVNEAGASVYSASKLASEEFPKFDVGQRSAASIARRLQDPLAELVKIEPQSIGVGQYQHDMNQKKLGESLSGVVEDCVNKVGVDLNTASAPLLSYISGISGAIAKNIVAYRDMTVLKDYYRVIKQKAELIKKYEQQEDWHAYTIETHALKSASRQIGATDLAESAARLELAGSRQDAALIHEQTASLLHDYLQYQSILQPYFQKEEKISAQETITAPVLEKLFYAMYDAIDNLNSDTMESTLEEMTHFIYPDNQQEFLNQLKTAVSDIDVEQCTKILDAWKSVV